VIVLDTNVISEVLSPSPSESVINWLERHDAAEMRFSAVSVTEVAYGIALLPEGARRTALAGAWAELLDSWRERILAVGALEAEAAAAFLALRRRQGRPVALGDALIAGTCLAHDHSLATRNTRDFAGSGVDVINPWGSAHD
jgi:toxin FitB